MIMEIGKITKTEPTKKGREKELKETARRTTGQIKSRNISNGQDGGIPEIRALNGASP